MSAFCYEVRALTVPAELPQSLDGGVGSENSRVQLTIDKDLSQRDQTENVGVEHGLHVVLCDLANLLRAENHAGAAEGTFHQLPRISIIR